MDIIVLKFGGSSVANNERLRIVANKLIEYKNENKKVVVILSAQGKMTNELINEANELSSNIEKRELDMLVSTGEQISCAKLSILLNDMGHSAVSLTGWQAGIFTDDTTQNANIQSINTARILEELGKDKIVIITGFQGINKQKDITTLR